MSETVTGGEQTSVIEPASNTEVVVQPGATGVEISSDKDKERAIKDMLKFKAMVRDSEAKIAALEKERDNERLERHKSRDEWKTIAEEHIEKANKLEDENKNIRRSVVNNERLKGLREQCLKLGIREEALDDITEDMMNSVEYETTSTGRINLLNAKQVAEDIKLRRPFWFGKASAPSVNGQVPSVGGSGDGPISPKRVLELEAEYKKTRSPETLAALKRAYGVVQRT